MTKSIGETVRDLRNRKGLTQKELATRLDCRQATIAGWESNKGRSPGKKLVKKVAEALEVSLDYLLNQKESNHFYIPCYAEVNSQNFIWSDQIIYDLEVVENEYRIGRFSLKILFLV